MFVSEKDWEKGKQTRVTNAYLHLSESLPWFNMSIPWLGEKVGLIRNQP